MHIKIMNRKSPDIDIEAEYAKEESATELEASITAYIKCSKLSL